MPAIGAIAHGMDPFNCIPHALEGHSCIQSKCLGILPRCTKPRWTRGRNKESHWHAFCSHPKSSYTCNPKTKFVIHMRTTSCKVVWAGLVGKGRGFRPTQLGFADDPLDAVHATVHACTCARTHSSLEQRVTAFRARQMQRPKRTWPKVSRASLLPVCTPPRVFTLQYKGVLEYLSRYGTR